MGTIVFWAGEPTLGDDRWKVLSLPNVGEEMLKKSINLDCFTSYQMLSNYFVLFCVSIFIPWLCSNKWENRKCWPIYIYLISWHMYRFCNILYLILYPNFYELRWKSWSILNAPPPPCWHSWQASQLPQQLNIVQTHQILICLTKISSFENMSI